MDTGFIIVQGITLIGAVLIIMIGVGSSSSNHMKPPPRP